MGKSGLQCADRKHEGHGDFTPFLHLEFEKDGHGEYKDDDVLEDCVGAVRVPDGVDVEAFAFDVAVPEGLHGDAGENCEELDDDGTDCDVAEHNIADGAESTPLEDLEVEGYERCFD